MSEHRTHTGTRNVLLDCEMDHPTVDEIRAAVDSRSTSEARITDLHFWREGKSSFACALTGVVHEPRLTPGQVRQRLAAHRKSAPATIDVPRCA